MKGQVSYIEHIQPLKLMYGVIAPYTRKKPNGSAGYIKLKPYKVGDLTLMQALGYLVYS